MNMLAMGATRLQEQMEIHAGVSTTYRRVNSSMQPFSFNIVAVPGRNPVDVVDSNGVIMRSQVQDFIFSISKLRKLMTSEPKKPIRGDEIIATLGDFRVVFIVNGEDFARSHYEPADSYGVAWRVHTKADRVESS